MKPKLSLPPTQVFSMITFPTAVLTNVQVTSSPPATVIAFTGLPSLHVALVRSHPAGGPLSAQL